MIQCGKMWKIRGGKLKLGKRGSFTAEATVIITIIILVLLVLIQSYLSQFLFQYVRTAQGLGSYKVENCDKGIYFDRYVYRGQLTFLDEKEQVTESYDESLNYLFLMHSYLLLDEVGEELWDGAKNFNK